MADQEEEQQRRRELAKKVASWRPESGEQSRPGGGPGVAASDGASASGASSRQTMDRRIERSRWPVRRVLAYGVGVLVAGVVLYELILGDHSTKLNVQVDRITIATVERGPFQEFIPVRGEVLPIQTIFLDAQESGRVEEVYLEAGAMVDRGDPLLKLSNPDLEITVMNQEAVFYEQLNNFENTRINLNQQSISRQRELLEIEQQLRRQRDAFELAETQHAKGLISDRGFDAARADYDFWMRRHDFAAETVRQDSLSRKARLAQMSTAQKRLQNNLEAARRSLESLTVRAPVGGQLTSLNAEVGELKTKGERLGQIDVLDGFKVRAGIDEFYITRINEGQTGTFTLGGEDYRLTIRHVYPEVIEGRFNVDLAFTGDEPDDIRRGQTLPIRLALGDLEEALLLERGGFYQATGGNWVFVVDADGDTASRRDIRTGRQNPEYFEILEGLKPGERVVTSSYENYEEIDKLVLVR